MILEGIVTTLSESGEVNVAPMGPELPGDSPDFDRCLLKPFQTSQTCSNLRAHPEAVLHVTDDVLLLAQAAVGVPDPFPEIVRAESIGGFRLKDCCRAYELRITSSDVEQQRAVFSAEVTHTISVRPFFGFNRARHAVLEAAILATRVRFLSLTEIKTEFGHLEVLVRKTGGEREKQAFAHLASFVDQSHSDSIHRESED